MSKWHTALINISDIEADSPAEYIKGLCVGRCKVTPFTEMRTSWLGNFSTIPTLIRGHRRGGKNVLFYRVKMKREEDAVLLKMFVDEKINQSIAKRPQTDPAMAEFVKIMKANPLQF